MKSSRKYLLLLAALLIVVLCTVFFAVTTSAAETNAASVTVGEETTEYATFEEALQAASNQQGARITLLKDSKAVFAALENPVIPQTHYVSAKITLDLNGHILGCTRGCGIFMITTGGSLTVVDEKGGVGPSLPPMPSPHSPVRRNGPTRSTRTEIRRSRFRM